MKTSTPLPFTQLHAIDIAESFQSGWTIWTLFCPQDSFLFITLNCKLKLFQWFSIGCFKCIVLKDRTSIYCCCLLQMLISIESKNLCAVSVRYTAMLYRTWLQMPIEYIHFYIYTNTAHEVKRKNDVTSSTHRNYNNKRADWKGEQAREIETKTFYMHTQIPCAASAI